MSVNGKQVCINFYEFDGGPSIRIDVLVGATLIGTIQVPSHESLSPEVKTLIGRIAIAGACSILKDQFKP